ncbi:MAG: hypothetical protein PVJ57_06665 [Phycisphaerae bacterium]
MTHWLRLRPMLVLAMFIAAPAAALAHLMWTWVPQAVAVRHLTSELSSDARSYSASVDELAVLQGHTRRLNELADQNRDSVANLWLPRREHYRVSDTLAETLQGDGVTVTRLTFGEPVLYAADAEAGVLACEQATIVCRGTYAGLSGRLDRLASLDLPLRIVRATWTGDGPEVEVSLDLQVPFVPEGALAELLREEAGFYEDEDDES